MPLIEETKDKIYTGSCHCGAVTLEMHGPLHPFVICHCDDCTNISGYTWAAAQMPYDNLKITTGADHVDWYASSENAKRGFCKTCHAHMFFHLNDADYASVSVGMFDHYDGLYTMGHIFRQSLADCCQNDDSLPDIDETFYGDEYR